MKAGSIVGSLLLISGIVCSDAVSAQNAQTGAVPQGLADGPYVHFVAMRHEEGARVANAGATRATNAEVKALEARILASQQNALKELRQFMSSVVEDMAPADKTVLKKLPAEDLDKSSGAAFDRLCLDLMIQHHRDNLAMTRGAKLTTPTVQDFARRLDARLAAELKELEALRKKIA